MSNTPVPGFAEKMADFYFAQEGPLGPLVFIGEADAVSAALTYAKKLFQADHPDAEIERLSASQFLNELIKSIRYQETELYMNYLRSMDLLLLEGFEEIRGMERTQMEVYGLFDYLYEHGRRFVIGMSVPPKDIPTLEDRVRTQLEGGLLCRLSDDAE